MWVACRGWVPEIWSSDGTDDDGCSQKAKQHYCLPTYRDDLDIIDNVDVDEEGEVDDEDRKQPE